MPHDELDTIWDIYKFKNKTVEAFQFIGINDLPISEFDDWIYCKPCGRRARLRSPDGKVKIYEGDFIAKEQVSTKKIKAGTKTNAKGKKVQTYKEIPVYQYFRINHDFAKKVLV
jgi:hypothetical protein